MIARVWTAAASPDGARDYRRHLEDAVFPLLAALDGQRGAYLLVEEREGTVEILVLTLWESMEAVHAFAGDSIEVAVVEQRAREVLSRYDRTVRHYRVVASLPPLDAPPSKDESVDGGS